jgi:hypothetical protein
MLSAERVYSMLGNAPLWGAAKRCHGLLAAADIPHAVVGGAAVCLNGYQRNTIDLDVLIRSEDSAIVRDTLTGAGFIWNEDRHEFVGQNDVPVRFLYAGDRAGSGSPVSLPDPTDRTAVTFKDGLSVLSLAKLIEVKLACGESNLRRTHKDFADVVELIAANELGQSFARFLHKSLRPTFRELVRRAHGEP